MVNYVFKLLVLVCYVYVIEFFLTYVFLLNLSTSLVKFYLVVFQKKLFTEFF